MPIVIDRFEGAFAVVEAEDGSFTSVERALLPPDAWEGDVLARGEDGRWRVDAAATGLRRARIRRKLDALWEE